MDCLDYGCQGIDIYLPNNPSKSELNCFGHGCYDMNFYINKGFGTGFGKNNVLLNACGKCKSIDQCVSNWRISCEDPNAGHNDERWMFDNLYNGSVCSSTNCGCSNDLLNGIFKSIPGDDGCKVLTLDPSPSPTPAPTLKVTPRPTKSPIITKEPTDAAGQQSGGGSRSGGNHTLMYVLVSIGSVIGTVILLGIGWYLMKKRKSKKVIHRVIKEIVEDEENDKDTEMVLSENLNTETQSKPYEKL